MPSVRRGIGGGWAGLLVGILIAAISLRPSVAQAEDDGPVVLPAAESPAPASAAAAGSRPPGPRDEIGHSPSDALPAAAGVAPGPLPATEAPPVPEPSLAVPRLVYKRRYNLALFGGALLLASYTADRLLMGDLSKSGFAWIPLAGPWFLLDLQLRQPVPNSATVLFLAIDGLLQAGGLTMTVLGLVLRERRQTVRLLAPPPVLRPVSGSAP